MAVTGVLKKCADCGTVFVAENPASKYCPCCSARRNIPGPARGNGYRKPPPDALTLDVRAADAAGLSYGVWRAREDDRKRKAKETIRRQIEGVGIRIVQDKGAGVQGYHLDVAVDTHENALAWSGYGEHRVWIIREAE